MPGTNNFLEFNPTGANQENDGTYAADAQRLGGATSPSLFAATLANKAFFQWSRMVVAVAQMMANKGYNMSDAVLNNLINSLSNIVTNADVPTILNNTVLTGDPHCPTPPVGDNDLSVVNSAFVKAVFGTGFAISLGNTGYIKLPDQLGGIIIQWIHGPADSAGGEHAVTLSFPLTFPVACYHLQATMMVPTATTQEADALYQVISFTNSSVTLFLQEFSNGRAATVSPFVLAIGH